MEVQLEKLDPDESYHESFDLLSREIGKSWKPVAMQKAPIFHAKMYATADKYNIVGLRELALEKFVADTADYFTNPAFYDAIDTVYATTPANDRLRKAVANSLCADIKVYGLRPPRRREIGGHP
ncbi:hypothetical protein K458DRAFT_435282 [Lentithecium fluviatile CBS 122367]|uniref:Uncharacterized protein n=1 Tax=Lentithecium fluviatile CBS 122367 TaxID=1168545 RepID=A0A6G1IN09_9PLEO|nr:hypothetical protein K458DRAFT_435282 [Lentithecium fluviatile CBS 122367]